MVLFQLMKRAIRLAICGWLFLCLAGCDFWGIIWQGIIGKGYYQLTQSSIANKSGSMTASPIDLGALSTGSVIIYRTDASSLYGKLSLVTAPLTGNLAIKFVTYAADGTTRATSEDIVIPPGSSFSLESGIVTSAPTSDFLFSSPGTLTPQNKAVFFLAVP
jgi:hypothetical protein